MAFVGERLMIRSADPQDARHPRQLKGVPDPVAAGDDAVCVVGAIAVTVKEDHRQRMAQGAQPGIGDVMVIPRPPKEQGRAGVRQGRLQRGEAFRCRVILDSGSERDVHLFMREGAQTVLPRERPVQVEDRKTLRHAHHPD